MRARKKKNTIPRLEKNKRYLTRSVELTADRPVYMEIGCGKGKFATGMAQAYDCMFYALEKVPDVMVMAMEKAAEQEIENIRFILADATELKEICPDNSVDIIFLNFSDPWPKNKDYKKRLTYRTFLEEYRRILKPDGIIKIKTDNKNLFEFSLREMKAGGFDLYDLTENLHSSDIENDVMTEYETRFVSLGMPIYHVKAKLNKQKEKLSGGPEHAAEKC